MTSFVFTVYSVVGGVYMWNAIWSDTVVIVWLWPFSKHGNVHGCSM